MYAVKVTVFFRGYIMKENNENKIVKISVASFLVIAASAIFIYLIFHLGKVLALLGGFLKIIAPIIYGFIIAFIVNPVSSFFEIKIFKAPKRKPKTAKRLRALSIVISLILYALVISGFFRLVIPEVYSSVQGIIKSFPDYEKNVEKWLSETGDKLPENVRVYFNYDATDIMNETYDFLTENIAPKLNDWMNSIKNGIFSVITFLLNLIIGIIVSVYLVFNKEHMLGQCKKVIYALMDRTTANDFIHNARFINKTFGNFFVGKIADSIIIGLICFILMTILGFDYAALISVIIGVTNIIPVFGPFIGAIPSAFLIFMVDPVECLYFLILVFALQQFDGNILGPKILGSSTGLSGFWVIFAITVFGGWFKIAGMLVGVPIFAVIYAGFKSYVDAKLAAKGLETNTTAYRDVNNIDEDGNYIQIPKEEIKELASKKKGIKPVNPFALLFGKDKNADDADKDSEKNSDKKDDDGSDK